MQEQPIKLDEADVRVGMALEMDAIRLQAQLDGINRAARLLADEMYTKYGINRDEYQLSNWLAGFEPVSAFDGLAEPFRNGGDEWQT